MPILRKLRHEMAKTGVRAPLVWMRHKSLRANDVFFASYPRSGSTWMRFLLYESIAGQSSGFGNVNQSIPDVPKTDVPRTLRTSPELAELPSPIPVEPTPA